MIELTCRTCEEKVGVESLLAAAQQSCSRCGQLLMGPLERSRRTVRPSAVAELSPQQFEPGRGSVVGLWLGVLGGGLLGLSVVGAVAFFGPAIPLQVRGALLGALAGVLLAPVLAVGSFLLMLIPPLNLIGMIGDSAWSRMARALHERRLRHLIFPVFIFVVLPMAGCGLGASKTKAIDPGLLMSAGLGAVILGSVVGGACGNRSR